jgi:hypothetical protein
VGASTVLLTGLKMTGVVNFPKEGVVKSKKRAKRVPEKLWE